MELSVKDIKNEKKYLDNEIEDVLSLISFNRQNLSILGSYGLRSSLYPSDIDAEEVVNYDKSTIKKIQQIIKNVNNRNDLFITDIKLGSVDDYEVVKDNAYVYKGMVYNYNASDSREKLKELYKKNVITKEEFNKWSKLIINNPTQEQLIEIQKEIRPNLMRWNTAEILKNKKHFRGIDFNILDALQTGGLFKIDYVFIKPTCEFIDINVIYDVRMKGLRQSKSPLLNIKRELQREISRLIIQGKYFKALKRKFSLAKINNNKKQIIKLYKILNSPIGILHQISGNCEILILLLEQNNKRVPLDKLRCFVNEFIDRLNNVFNINQYIKQERFIVSKIQNIIKSNNKKTIMNNLIILKDKLDNIKNTVSKKYINI
jgi:hypothetical protein